MRPLLFSLISLLALAGVSALVTWKVVGPPDRTIPCVQDDLEKGHVCLKTVRSWEEDTILWVDARKREAWRKDGVDQSVLVNEHEEWNEMVAKFATAVFGEGTVKGRVVVYCDKSGCDSSKVVAKRLREELGQDFGFETFVLHGGILALEAERP